MKISYLIGVHNEEVELNVLLNKLYNAISKTEDEIVILDDYSDNVAVRKMLELHKCFSTSKSVGKVVQHHLNGDFSSHKNFGGSHCTGDYIVNFDADEYPSDFLLENIHFFTAFRKKQNIISKRLPPVLQALIPKFTWV